MPLYTCTSVIEHSSRVTLEEPLGKQFHDAINLLCLSWQMKAEEKHPAGRGRGGVKVGGEGEQSGRVEEGKRRDQRLVPWL